MTIVKGLIRSEKNKTLSFGDYTLAQKTKLADFKHEGSSYKVKTFKEITKLEKDGMFVYESVPGTAVNNFKATDTEVEFLVEGFEDSQIIIELQPEQNYQVSIDGKELGIMKTNLGGKLTMSLELNSDKQSSVYIKKA